MVPQQRRDIGADAHEAAMAERHQAEAAHDRPRGVGERPDQDQHQDVQVIGIAIDEGQRDQRCKANGPGGVTGIHERLASKARGPDEHHDDEEGEGQHVAPFEIGEQPAQRNDLREHERRDEAADEIAEPAEHADQEGDRPERQPDEGMHVVLQHQQAGGEAGERAAQRRGDEIDALGVDAHQRHDLAVLRDGADRGACIGALHEADRSPPCRSARRQRTAAASS